MHERRQRGHAAAETGLDDGGGRRRRRRQKRRLHRTLFPVHHPLRRDAHDRAEQRVAPELERVLGAQKRRARQGGEQKHGEAEEIAGERRVARDPEPHRRLHERV